MMSLRGREKKKRNSMFGREDDEFIQEIVLSRYRITEGGEQSANGRLETQVCRENLGSSRGCRQSSNYGS